MYGDDEFYNESCSLKNFNHRFECDQDNNRKCIVRSRVFDNFKDCLDCSDEPRQVNEILERSIPFQTLCDGFIELLPILIDEQNHTGLEKFFCTGGITMILSRKYIEFYTKRKPVKNGVYLC